MINHLWQSTVFAVVAGLLAIALRRNRAQVRYWLWLSASLKFLVPFALLLSLGSHLERSPAVKKIAAAPAIAVAMEQIAQPFPETAPVTRETRDWRPVALFGVWACGFAAIALIRFRGWLRIRAAVRASTMLDLPAPVEIRSAPGLLEPGVVGAFRPILLLPQGIAQHLTPPQLEAVLAHELCHVRRRDNLFASMHMLVEAMFWFHPLVWWIGARLVEERERACDEEVLTLGSQPRDYAEGILNVCKLYVESPLACVSGVTGSDIKRRIEAIMNNRIVLSLNLGKKLALAAAGIAAVAVPIVVGVMKGQPAATPKWEVAAIRAGCTGGGGGDAKGGPAGGGGGAPSPGRLTQCSNVMGFIRDAYVFFANGNGPINNPFSVPIEGGPVWINSERYTITAKAEGNETQQMMRGPMMQTLLEDRFKLKIHRETREVPVYALTEAKGGFKMKRTEPGSCFSPDKPPAQPAPGQMSCGSQTGSRGGPNRAADWHGVTLDELARFFLVGMVDRPVINKTGITGMFDAHLEYAPDETAPRPDGADPGEPTAPSIFTAMQEQLGLKLEPTKGPGEFLVIDSVEKPSEN